MTHWCNKDGLLGGGEEGRREGRMSLKKSKRLQIDFLRANRKRTKPKKHS